MTFRPMPGRWKAVVFLVTIFSVTFPGPASASAISFAFTGGGWGHGVGMSQYGAKGQADAGRTYTDILTHYFQGTTIAPAPMPPAVRVGVLWDQPEVLVTSEGGPFEFHYESPGGAVLAMGAVGEVWRVSADATGKFVVRRPDGSVHIVQPGGTKSLFVDYEPHGSILRLPQTGRPYKYGVLELNTFQAGGLWLVRAIIADMTMQQYLYGLGEVPSSWPPAALRAQAVAGRSYALEKINNLGQFRPVCNCALYASTADQAYVGFDKETAPFGANWRTAVYDTNAIVVFYAGTVIPTYYSSSSGGHTENNEYVWGGGPRPYLRGVPDPWDAVSPNFSWTVTFDLEDLQNRLNAFSDTAVGVLYDVETLAPYGVSGRVRSVISSDQGGVRLTGSAGTKRVSGDRIRSVLGLKSTLFRVTKTGAHPNGTVLQGSGPAVYRLEEGRLTPFTSPHVFETWARWSEIVTVADASLLQYRGPRLGFRDGTLILTTDGTVWIISNGQRRGFTSAEVFTGLGYSWSNIVAVSSEEAGLHPVGLSISSTNTHPDGTLLKGSSPAVWWLQNGAKRPIASAGTFESWFRWAEIVNVTDSKLASYPDGPILGYRDGTLMLSPNGTVWVSSDGYRRGFTSAEAFNGLGYSWANVKPVSSEEAAVLPVGQSILSSAEPHPSGTLLRGSLPYRFIMRGSGRVEISSDKIFASWGFRTSEIVRIDDTRLAGYIPGNAPKLFRDGTLISTPDSTVWIISNGLRRGFTSPASFTGLGYSWSNIVPVSWSEAELHGAGSAIFPGASHPDGTVFKGSGPAVWWLQGGRKRPVASAAIFESWFRWPEIVQIDDGTVNSYPYGPTLGFRDGSLIVTPDTTVWAISDGLRRGFTSENAFVGLGYSWANIRDVTAEEANLHPAGRPIS